MAHDTAQPSVPSFGDIRGVKPVPVVDDWRSLSREEFLARSANVPLLLRGLGSESRAFKEWDRAFFRNLVEKPVNIVTEKHLGAKDYPCHAQVSLEEFISFLDGPDRVYLREWYVFRDHPELLPQLIDTFPPYLLDDWMEVIPNGWAFNRGSRNNVYWGSHGTSTACHYDSLNTVTWNTTLRGVKRWLFFSARTGAPGQEAWVGGKYFKDVMKALGAWEDKIITPGMLARYLSKSPAEFPDLEIYTVDVPAGSTVFVPWRWAHQVHNIGECFAVSRYYISDVNYDACRGLVEQKYGSVAGTVFRGLLGTPARRRFWQNRPFRKVAESYAGRRSFFFMLYLAGLGNITDNFLTPDKDV